MTIVDAGVRKPLELEVVVPVEDMAASARSVPARGAARRLGRRRRMRAASIWPQIHPRILELIRAHRCTIVFVNSRRLAERLALRSTSWPARSSSAPTTARSRARSGC